MILLHVHCILHIAVQQNIVTLVPGSAPLLTHVCVCVYVQSGGSVSEDPRPSLRRRGCESRCRPSAPTSAAFN